MTSKKLGVIAIVLNFQLTFGVGNEICKTPDNISGRCTSIRECGYLYDHILKLLRNETISDEETTFLKRSHCGFIGAVPKVCCKYQTNTLHIPDDVLPTDTTLLDLLPNTTDCGLFLASKIRGGRSALLENFPWMGFINHDSSKSVKFVKKRENCRGLSCGVEELPPAPGVSGGTYADLTDFPWLALLTYELTKSVRRPRQFGCEGFLISKRYVLTAAHCLKGGERSLFEHWKLVAVRLGEYNRDSDQDCLYNGFRKVCLPFPPIDVGVEEYKAHEKFNPEFHHDHDIGLIRLAENVKFNDYVTPICLPVVERERKKSYFGSLLTVTGWGSTGNNTHSSIKLKVDVEVKHMSHCRLIFEEIGVNLNEKHICAGGDDGKNACPGDSGAPLMKLSPDHEGKMRWYAAGIVSAGELKCQERLPAIYTRVSKYLGWILRNIKP